MVQHYFKHFSKIVVLFYALKNRGLVIFLLDAPSCGLKREAKSFFPLTEIMPFKFKYNLNFDNI